MLKNSKKKIFVRICPRCGSKNVENEVKAFRMGQFYVCNTCGFRGSLFPEISKKWADKIKIRDVYIHKSKTSRLTISPVLFYLAIIIIIILLVIVLR